MCRNHIGHYPLPANSIFVFASQTPTSTKINEMRMGKKRKNPKKENLIELKTSNRSDGFVGLWTQRACGFIHLIYKQRHLNSLNIGHRLEMFCCPRCPRVPCWCGRWPLPSRIGFCGACLSMNSCVLCPVNISIYIWLCDDHDGHHDAEAQIN